jgi:3-methyladenine DNA glycosylase/8-oxoguanine DNA glycosylase
MERYLKAEVWEQTGKSETHLSHFEKWFSSSPSLSKIKERNGSVTRTAKGVKMRVATAQTPGEQLVYVMNWRGDLMYQSIPCTETSYTHAAI